MRLGQPALIFLAGTKKSSTPKFYFKTLKFIEYFISQFQDFKDDQSNKKTNVNKGAWEKVTRKDTVNYN